MSKRTYMQIKQELEEILDWFEGDSVEIDEAIEKHALAEKLITELEVYLKGVTKKPKKS